MSDDPTMSEMPPPRATRTRPTLPRPNPKSGPPTAAATAASTTAATTPTPTREAPPQEQKKVASDILHRLRTMQDMNPEDVDHDDLLDTVDELLFQGRIRMGEPQQRSPERGRRLSIGMPTLMATKRISRRTGRANKWR